MRSRTYQILKNTFKPYLEPLIKQSPYALQPRIINLDVSWACNLKCVMCSAKMRVNRESRKYLSPEQFKHILGQLPHLKRIYFMGLGEPLTNPDLIALLAAASRRRIKVSLITNGMLLRETMVRRFPDNLERISVSIDSASAEKLAEIRVGARLSIILENIRALKTIRPDVDVRILTVLMTDTIDELPEIVKLAKSVGASAVDVSHLIAMDASTDNRRITGLSEHETDAINMAEETARAEGIDFISRPLEPRMRCCIQPWLAPLIMLNGDVLPCAFMDRSADPMCPEWYAGVKLDVPFHQYRMGNLFDEPFSHIWNNKSFKQIRRTIRDSESNTSMAVDAFNLKRRGLNPDEEFAYCRFCLVRWHCAC